MWDNEAVEKLLDRSQVKESDEATADVAAEEKGGFNEYLRSFKVASYQVKSTKEDVSTRACERDFDVLQ